jgi:hypothetical protein
MTERPYPLKLAHSGGAGLARALMRAEPFFGGDYAPADQKIDHKIDCPGDDGGTTLYVDLYILADPDDPRDLFGMLQRSRGLEALAGAP